MKMQYAQHYRKIARTCLWPAEYDALKALAERNKVPLDEYLRAIVVDVLVEEGFDGLQCRRTKGHSQSGERQRRSRAPAPRSLTVDNVLVARQGVGS